MLTDRNAILATDDLKRVEVHVEPWGDSVLIREMTVDENEQWQKRWLEQESGGAGRYDGIRAHLVALSVIDAAGRRIFADGDIEALSAKSARAVTIVFDAAMKLNKLADKDIDALEKNFASAPSAPTASASPNV